MCGIWTLINLKNSFGDLSKYLEDFWNLKNRGPDNSSIQTYSDAVVGFHRLAIMDKSFKSNQPFVLTDKLKTIVFVCNGEIYNFKELINQYNLDINDNSDCLTIPKLYLKLEEKKWLDLFQNEIKGEYAFTMLIFDNLHTLKKVYVGRDQIGIRPLYFNKFTKDSDKLIFSSEVKGTLSMIEKIHEFPPGEIYKYNFDEFKKVELDTYNFKNVYQVIPDEIFVKDESYYLSNLRNAIINSVRRRLVADRPLAFLLSGGVDSSLVCAIAAKILKHPIKTFCCGMKGGTDLVYAKMVADHIKSHHTEVYFTAEEGLNCIDSVIWAIESWDTTTVRASVGQYLVSKYIGTKTDCRVVLVGEGPDEVCSSYLFNWYAPNGNALHNTAKDYVDEIHVFDSKRGDRCISNWGLEGRVPLLDPEVIKAYWEIPSEWRMPEYKGIEKWWLRKAFEDLDLLPHEVLWRKKEAFSDGVSSKENSWYSIIQDKCESDISSEEMVSNDYDVNPPTTKEAYLYRTIFSSYFGIKNDHIIPHYWQPKWNNKGEEVKEYIDPSARVLAVYN